MTTPTWAALSVQQQHSEETPILSVLGPPCTVHSLYSNGSGPQMLLPFIVSCTFDTLRLGTLSFPLGGCVSARRDAANWEEHASSLPCTCSAGTIMPTLCVLRALRGQKRASDLELEFLIAVSYLVGAGN